MTTECIQIFFQIILESLPISSSGHLILLQKIMGWTSLPRSFEYLAHIPTIGILVFYFRGLWYPLLWRVWRYKNIVGRMIGMVICVDSITAFVYILMQQYGAGLPLWMGFLVTAILLFSLLWAPDLHKPVTFSRAVGIGLAQGMAGLPGVSRLASTYVAGVWLGLSSRKSFYFSCMIQFPLMCAGVLCGVFRLAHENIFLDVTRACFFPVIIAIPLAYVVLWLVQRMMEDRMLWKVAYYMAIPLAVAFLT